MLEMGIELMGRIIWATDFLTLQVVLPPSSAGNLAEIGWGSYPFEGTVCGRILLVSKLDCSQPVSFEV